jgi:hypothetical protein
VGCLNAEADGTWGEKSRAALRDFARYAKLSIDDDEPNISLFDAAAAAKSRVCPLHCADDEVTRDGRCVAKERPRHREEEQTRHRVVRQSAERARRENVERPRSSGSGICFNGPGRGDVGACK